MALKKETGPLPVYPNFTVGKKYIPKDGGRPVLRMFESDFLEKFSYIHPIGPLLIWVPFIVYLLYRSFAVHQLSIAAVLGLGLGGFLVWTLSEYILHRYVFHYQNEDSKIMSRLHFMIHGVHHDDPEDPMRLVMPPAAAMILAIPFWITFRATLGQAFAEPFFAFFLVGYLCYDYIHYAVHHFRPRTPLGKFLKQNHMLHHFVTPEARWGVSSPLWDYILGTTDQAKKAAHVEPEQQPVT